MADIKRVHANVYASEQQLWHRCAARLSAHGLDLRQLSAQWAERQKLKLTTFEARDGFDRLCQHGCVPQVLAAIVALVRHGPDIKTAWTHFMGDAETRRKTIRSLEKTAQVLEGIWGGFIETEDESELLRKPFELLDHLSPSQLVSELRFHVQFLNFAELIAKGSETRSLGELFRYLLTSYVKQATGKFHDSETSGLLADIVGPLDYNEVAQRMWRLRNYKRLDTHHSDLTEKALGMAAVINRPT